MNSSFREKVVNNNLRESVFRRGTTHPMTFTSSDFQSQVSSDKYFARRFDESMDSKVLSLSDDFIDTVERRGTFF